MPAAETSYLCSLLEQGLPDAATKPLRRLLRTTMPAAPDQQRYAISACGRFHGAHLTDLLAYAETSGASGALVVAEGDAERVLYLSVGAVVGAGSTVLFERLGRLLYRAKVVTHDDAETLVGAEETHGGGALLLWLSPPQLAWAVERRVWEVGGALAFVKRGHFVFVQGEPRPDGPAARPAPPRAHGPEPRDDRPDPAAHPRRRSERRALSGDGRLQGPPERRYTRRAARTPAAP